MTKNSIEGGGGEMTHGFIRVIQTPDHMWDSRRHFLLRFTFSYLPNGDGCLLANRVVTVRKHRMQGRQEFRILQVYYLAKYLATLLLYLRQNWHLCWFRVINILHGLLKYLGFLSSPKTEC